MLSFMLYCHPPQTFSVKQSKLHASCQDSSVDSASRLKYYYWPLAFFRQKIPNVHFSNWLALLADRQRDIDKIIQTSGRFFSIVTNCQCSG